MLPAVSGPDPATTDPASLREAWVALLRDRAEGPSLPEAISIERAGTILAADDPRLDADEAIAELRDRIVVEMLNAILDVEDVAARLPLELTAAELRARIDGEVPMTLYEYAHIRHTIANT